jgi:hypothetical protein
MIASASTILVLPDPGSPRTRHRSNSCPARWRVASRARARTTSSHPAILRPRSSQIMPKRSAMSAGVCGSREPAWGFPAAPDLLFRSRRRTNSMPEMTEERHRRPANVCPLGFTSPQATAHPSARPRRRQIGSWGAVLPSFIISRVMARVALGATTQSYCKRPRRRRDMRRRARNTDPARREQGGTLPPGTAEDAQKNRNENATTPESPTASREIRGRSAPARGLEPLTR